ncbi:DUF5985 family protein [Massilia sp. 9096]|uniref:DUF5985 family protein n=1 Tax=Massilia sp. 9096 TaxID=1500894 RepID=UPI000AFE712A|nr:DUF5985 family protein [Massilia sp. 9096]
MAFTIYSLCTLTSLACTWLLFASYRRTRVKLLFWSALSFAAMTVNNLFLVLDKIVFPGPEIDLLPVRLWAALVSTLLLLFGLIYAKE